ncbi:MAG: DUF1488 domain-containing protein [Janthinobacterium lividum]
MDIFFPDEAPAFYGAPPEVQFTVLVDGEPVVCAVSAEALSDHFDADGPFEEAMLAAFDAGRHQIFSVCRAALERSAGHPVILRSGIFRFANASGRA